MTRTGRGGNKTFEARELNEVAVAEGRSGKTSLMSELRPKGREGMS
jgi:hypothetical protein